MRNWEEAAKVADEMAEYYLAQMDLYPRRKTAFLQKFGAAQDIARALREKAIIRCDYPACMCAIKCDEIHKEVRYAALQTPHKEKTPA